MSDEATLRIHIDHGTGHEIASPEDSSTGGSLSLTGDQAVEWRKANPDLALKAKAESKAAAKAEDKAVKGPEQKG